VVEIQREEALGLKEKNFNPQGIITGINLPLSGITFLGSGNVVTKNKWLNNNEA